MKKRTVIAVLAAVGGLCALAAVGYRVVVLDWLMPHSEVASGYAAALDYSILTADLSALDAMAKQKHGPDARAVYGPDGATFRVGDQIVERPAMPRQIERIYGIFVMGRGEAMQRFPYSIVPDEDNRAEREAVSHERLKRFHFRAPEIFRYADRDWRLEGCRTVATPSTGLAFIDERLKLGSSDVCAIRWLKEPRGTMLVGGVAAEGGVWVRGWVVPLCRILATGWLRQWQGRGEAVDYIACNLIYDPHRPTGGPGDVVQERVYHVQNGALTIVR